MNSRGKTPFMRGLSVLPSIMDPLTCKYHPLQFLPFPRIIQKHLLEFICTIDSNTNNSKYIWYDIKSCFSRNINNIFPVITDERIGVTKLPHLGFHIHYTCGVSAGGDSLTQRLIICWSNACCWPNVAEIVSIQGIRKRLQLISLVNIQKKVIFWIWFTLAGK